MATSGITKKIVKPAMSNLPATKQDVIDFIKGMSNFSVKPEDTYHLNKPLFADMKKLMRKLY